MSITSIVLTGIIVVFLIFVILYMVFILMGSIFRQKKPPKQETVMTKEVKPNTEIENPEDESHIAIIGAVISEILGKPVIVKSVYSGRTYDMQDRTTTWRKSGWKGARGWRASSGW